MENQGKKYEDFVRQFTRAEPGLRAFLRALLPTAEDMEEVLQDTSLVLWKKFDVFEPGTNFHVWACVIARFEVLKYRRTKARDRLVFREDIIEMLADEAEEAAAPLERERHALRDCLAKLKERERALVLAVYTHGAAIGEAAEMTGRTVAAAYKALSRIRQALLKCIKRELAKEPLWKVKN
ncbi:MAG TPA: sigma-70 family RNA polymerase sigma factor [Verrucomicrobiales bacterium]|nr:sigma-70 family RNA polymerase sigma factor [Verrucomicrobiales bacterium]